MVNAKIEPTSVSFPSISAQPIITTTSAAKRMKSHSLKKNFMYTQIDEQIDKHCLNLSSVLAGSSDALDETCRLSLSWQ